MPTNTTAPTPGYPETTPTTPGEAQKPAPRPPRNPDQGGMEREPDPVPPGEG